MVQRRSVEHPGGRARRRLREPLLERGACHARSTWNPFELIVEMICECQGDTISGAPQLGKLNTQFFAVGWPVLMASSLMADARSWTTRSSTSQFFIQRSRSSMPAGYEKENAC